MASSRNIQETKNLDVSCSTPSKNCTRADEELSHLGLNLKSTMCTFDINNGRVMVELLAL